MMDLESAVIERNQTKATGLGQAFFLGGDSADTYVDGVLASRLRPLFAEWVGQCEILRRTWQSQFDRSIGKRVELLDRIVKPGAVLFGRSSGARVATLYASSKPVSAVICFGYPFRVPSRVLEPERFAHLAKIDTPTLIFQGLQDTYGGASITENYELSPKVTVKLVDCHHDYVMTDSQWDVLGETIQSFCRAACSRLPSASTIRFDEQYYLEAYPDVAAAVKEQHFASGFQHFEQHGRAEKRRFRVLQREG